MKKFLFAILMVLAMVSSAFAQPGLDDQGNPNDPHINERANACYEGASMSGKCDTQWEWTCGWYLIRFEQGLISRPNFPPDCASLLPPVGGGSPSTCIINLTGPIVGAPTTLIAPLSVINGGVDPNGVPNNPYGFDWGGVNRLNVVVPSGGFVVYDLSLYGGWYAPHVASTTCPTPVWPLP